MNIFYRRPLALILCIALGSFVFFTFFNSLEARIIAVLSAAIIFTVSFFKGVKERIPAILTRICAIVIIISSILSYIYFDLWYKAYERYNGEVKIVGTVENKSYNNNSNTTLYIKSRSVNDTPISSYKLIVYVDNYKTYNCPVGSEVTLVGNIEDFTSGKDFDAESYYFSRGFSGMVSDPVYFNCITDENEPASYKMSKFRTVISEYIINLSDNETGGLLAALLLGERDFLPLGTKVDFSRIGISHVLALSGMHLSLLVIGLSKLLSFFGVGKKSTTFISIFFTLIYMTLTGFSLSVTRAGVMLIVSSLLYLLSRTRDTMTSLFIAVTLIVISTPYSIYDTSLWLSAFATLGIVVFSELQGGKVFIHPSVNWILTSLLSTFFAIGATFIFTALKFDGISMLAPICTLIFSILIEVFVYIGILLIALGQIIPIKVIFIPIGNFILYLSKTLSELDFTYGITDNSAVKILSILFTVLFFAFFVLKIKHKKITVTALIFLLSSVFAISAMITHNTKNTEAILYSHNGGEQIIITDGGEIGVIDVASHKASTPYDTYSAITKHGLLEIDKYVIVNYSNGLDNSLEKLLNTVLIKEIYLPTPENYSEEKLYFRSLDLCKEAGTEAIRYQNEDYIRVGEASVIPIHKYSMGSSKKLLFTVLKDDEFHTYTTANMLTGETKTMASGIIGGSHTVIFGCHESSGNEFKLNVKLTKVNKFIFSSKNIVFGENVVDFYVSKDSYFNPEFVEIRH